MTVYFYKGVFSQFFKAPIVDNNGVRYICNEQYMMAHKAKLMGDIRSYKKIMRETKPMQIKKLGRRVQFWNQDMEKKYSNLVDSSCYSSW